ncbi:hypothetical protein BDW69DRAFT_177339 [Aspergillus filifer]
MAWHKFVHPVCHLSRPSPPSCTIGIHGSARKSGGMIGLDSAETLSVTSRRCTVAGCRQWD